MVRATSAARTVEVVPATEVDVPRAVALANAAFGVHELVTQPRTSVDLFPEECPPGARLLIVSEGEAMIGMAMIVTAHVEMFGFSEKVAQHVSNLGYPGKTDLYFGIASVHPSGQGKGVGRALLRRTEEVAAQEGFDRVVLTTVRELGSVEYYERGGYTVVASEIFAPGHYSIPVPHESCLMVKSL